MNKEQRIVYVQSKIACASIKASGMNADNEEAIMMKEYPKYTNSDFENLIIEYGIDSSAVASYLEGC